MAREELVDEVLKEQVRLEDEDRIVLEALKRVADDFRLTPGQRRTIQLAAEEE